MSSRAALAAAMALLSTACVAIQGGCATTEARSVRPAASRAEAATEVEPVGVGFACVRWFIAGTAEARGKGLARLVEDGIATEVESDLADNGFVLLRVERARLAEASAALSDATYARSMLLGQPLEWMDLATTPVRAGTVMFVAGRPRESADAILRLAFRGWCFPTVESASARVELRLGEDESTVAAVTIDPSRARPRQSDLPDGRAIVELGASEALLLAARPSVPAVETEKRPETSLPPTVASMLLDRSPFPNRATVLVIVPSLADILPEPSAARR